MFGPEIAINIYQFNVSDKSTTIVDSSKKVNQFIQLKLYKWVKFQQK